IGYYADGTMQDRAVYREGRRKGEHQKFDTNGDPLDGAGSGSDDDGPGSGLSRLVKKFVG
ncbi:MAG: hypothetical protein KC583_18065, partial [Myxococcales bacterium]|nr:hypothetical protein [Myxococcales bacterium]